LVRFILSPYLAEQRKALSSGPQAKFWILSKGLRSAYDNSSLTIQVAIVKVAAKRADIKNLAPHDLRRTCARLCHLAGGELEQIQFLLGHASVQTTEHYLGCKQKLRHAVNDNLGLEDL
jgi:integrase